MLFVHLINTYLATSLYLSKFFAPNFISFFYQMVYSSLLYALVYALSVLLFSSYNPIRLFFMDYVRALAKLISLHQCYQKVYTTTVLGWSGYYYFLTKHVTNKMTKFMQKPILTTFAIFCNRLLFVLLHSMTISAIWRRSKLRQIWNSILSLNSGLSKHYPPVVAESRCIFLYCRHKSFTTTLE